MALFRNQNNSRTFTPSEVFVGGGDFPVHDHRRPGNVNKLSLLTKLQNQYISNYLVNFAQSNVLPPPDFHT